MAPRTYAHSPWSSALWIHNGVRPCARLPNSSSKSSPRPALRPEFRGDGRSLGVRGIRIQDPGEVEEGIAAAFAHDGRSLGSELRALLDVGTNNQDWACLDERVAANVQ